MAAYICGTLKVSNMIWVIFSRLAFGLRGASVRRTGCSSGPPEAHCRRCGARSVKGKEACQCDLKREGGVSR